MEAEELGGARALTVAVVSDTHGRLSDELLSQLRGTDAIVHAGDMCSSLDYDVLDAIAPTFMCLGNNDWSFEYGDRFGNSARLRLGGLTWELCHYRERLDLAGADIAICGHTHRPGIETTPEGVLLMNPGSPTYPRGIMGPTIGRITIADGAVEDAAIVELPQEKKAKSWHW